MTEGRCHKCGGPTWHEGGGPAAKLCGLCRGDRPSYGADFRRERERQAKLVEAGAALCLAPECLEESRRILPGQSWDLGHDDRGGVRGPEHSTCNRSAGQAKTTAIRSSRGY